MACVKLLLLPLLSDQVDILSPSANPVISLARTHKTQLDISVGWNEDIIERGITIAGEL